MMEVTRKKFIFTVKQLWFADRPFETPGAARVLFMDCKNAVDAPGFSRSEQRTFVIDLTQDLRAIEENMSKGNVQRAIDRAKKAGITVTVSDDYESFYALYRSVARRKKISGMLSLADMKKHGLLFAAWHEGAMISGHVYLHDGSTMRSWAVGSQRFAAADSALVGNAGKLIIWEAITRAKAQGMKEFDFGGYNAGGMAGKILDVPNWFKESFGGNVITRYNYVKDYSLAYAGLSQVKKYGHAACEHIRGFKRKTESAIMIVQKIKNWPLYFLDHFHVLGDSYVVYRLRSGRNIKVRVGVPDWRWVFREVFIDQVYNPQNFAIENGDVVVDIGAHIGMFSVFASSHALKVYAIEPDADNFRLLQENININNAKNIIPFHAAISDRTGEKELLVNNTSFNHSFYLTQETGKKVKVSTVSLQDFIAAQGIDRIDFLKVDCEGSEYDIFLTCPAQVLRIIKKISMECHAVNAHWNARAMEKFLESNGFSVQVVPADSNFSYMFARNNLFAKTT